MSDIVERLRSWGVGELELEELIVGDMQEAAAEIERLRGQVQYEQERNANNVALADAEIEQWRKLFKIQSGLNASHIRGLNETWKIERDILTKEVEQLKEIIQLAITSIKVGSPEYNIDDTLDILNGATNGH